ncbi:MAG: lysophospholipid acyltransferase family protein [Armatimonadetes bacterium]|nr:lysophospholipid acyltransferase family protein [Armatimonadota bacterium]
MSGQIRFKDRLIQSVIFGLLWSVSTFISATVRLKSVGGEKLKKIISDGKGGIVLLWHGKTLLPIYYCRGMGFYALVSLSKDGELQNRLLRSRGLKTIRGSTGRGGAKALLELIRKLQEGGVAAITPDGPKGPVNEVQPGAVYIARKSGCPLLTIGVACRPCKRLGSWDSFMVPVPFSKAVVYFGEVFHISPDEDDDVAASRIKKAIDDAERNAWATLDNREVV